MRDSKIRVSKKFKKLLDDSALERIQNNIDKKVRSSRELTDMMMNTPSIEKVIRELKTIPKKEDIL